MSDTLRDWLAAHPPPDERYTQSLAGIPVRVRAGDEFLVAVRELLDEFGLAVTDAQRRRAIEAEPGETGDRRYDAYLAALAEHLAVHNDLDCPRWALSADRFLDRFWFVSDVAGFRATALAQSPMSFRRRGIFVPARSLVRV